MLQIQQNMAKAKKSKTKKVKVKSVEGVAPKKESSKDSTLITLVVPNPIYDDIADQAKADTRATGVKKSIHNKMIETLDKGRKV